MRWNPLLIALTMVTVGLAGCAGSDSQSPTDTDDPQEPTVTEDTGAIDGVVLSDDLLPLAGASVALQSDLSNARSTSDNGAFAFSGLEPGEYVVLASKLGYADGQQRAEVVAGEVTTVEFRLSPKVAEGVPSIVVLGPLPGRFFCAFAAGVAGPCKGVAWGPDHPVEQAWADISGDEENIFQLPSAIDGNRTADSDVLMNVLVEIEWEPVSASANSMQATVEKIPGDGGRNITDTVVYGYGKGATPLRVLVEPGVQGTGANAEMPADLPGFTVGVFPTGGEDVPAAFYTSQNFDVWITLFYNAPMEPDYSALGDT